MTAPAMSHATHTSANTARSGGRPSPLVLALDRLFPKRGAAPYAPLERLVTLVIVRAMSLDGDTGDWNCFLSYPTIARWSGTSVASVKRMLRKHGDGPAPLFFRTRSGQTRGHRHQCYRFTWVWHPEQFAAARDAARAERAEEVQRALRDLQPQRLALQRQLVDFGGTLTESDYGRKLKALEKAVRRKTPARAALKSLVSS
jgi:DNA-binding transcriptional MerR regulator